MAGLPWYARHWWAFALLALAAVALVYSGYLEEQRAEAARPPPEPWPAPLPSERNADGGGDARMWLSVILSLWSVSYMGTFRRYASIVGALGDRLSSVEVLFPFLRTTLHCTTVDGQDFYVYYHGSMRAIFAYYLVWIDLPWEPRFQADRYEGSVEHVTAIVASRSEGEGTWSVAASIDDRPLADRSASILAAVDALYAIKALPHPPLGQAGEVPSPAAPAAPSAAQPAPDDLDEGTFRAPLPPLGAPPPEVAWQVRWAWAFLLPAVASLAASIALFRYYDSGPVIAMPGGAAYGENGELVLLFQLLVMAVGAAFALVAWKLVRARAFVDAASGSIESAELVGRLRDAVVRCRTRGGDDVFFTYLLAGDDVGATCELWLELGAFPRYFDPGRPAGSLHQRHHITVRSDAARGRHRLVARLDDGWLDGGRDGVVLALERLRRIRDAR